MREEEEKDKEVEERKGRKGALEEEISQTLSRAANFRSYEG